ncbi:C40 family peptidase [Reichenbachiella ulvae]|uniref:C40 family peptidase n=1 Tax=Reichenbachiella ulvae TaxID=2980104 RepID=A0ABT3CQ78_9BACT|nr:C40 family peptidase [Reichenbachiella ulvae]MCV9385799.1 C40 family peptidase [Reichenbachiella ulvae]
MFKNFVLTFGMLIFGLFIFTRCANDDAAKQQSFSLLRDSVKNVYAPDKRVALFTIELDREEDSWVLTGDSDQPEAVAVLRASLIKQGIEVEDKVHMLPDSTVGDSSYAIVNNSVANIRSDSRHSSELATQALLGMKLKVLKRLEEWYLIQTPDDYISWVDHGGVQLMTSSEQLRWSKMPQIIYMNNYGNVYQDEEETAIVSDIVLGGRLVKLGESSQYYKVSYPDLRVGFVRKSEASDFQDWREGVEPSGEQVISYAQSLLGSPYLWGGTSTKGMDCSGFTKTAYLMNGYIIPRDASQQVNAGEVVDPDLNFEGLEKGDLLFFGRFATDSTSQRVTHVGLWMGDSSFIHASKQVRISSVDPESPNYDEFNKSRYLGSRRYLGNEKGITKWY